MSKNDREHFREYRDQTRVKHEIVRKYIPSFFHVLKNGQNNLIYIDGFAGRGTYDDSESGKYIEGSPLQALQVIAGNSDLASKVTSIFVEADHENFSSLKQAVDLFYSQSSHIRKPIVLHGTFADKITTLLDLVDHRNNSMAPTFLFVDPCGVSGTSLQVITRLLSNKGCEAFIFFNIDGIRRVCGLSKLSDSLVEVFGTKDRAEQLQQAFNKCSSPIERESTIVNFYQKALTEEISNNIFITPFAIEHEKSKRTSHYLIHVTKHQLGFKIMKDVMWKLGTSDEGTGDLGLIQASKYDGLPLFRPKWNLFKESIIAGLQNGMLRASVFYEDWVSRRDDCFAETAYREALLELEKEGRIVVLDKDGISPKPAEKRQKRKGKQTLGKDYYIASS